MGRYKKVAALKFRNKKLEVTGRGAKKQQLESGQKSAVGMKSKIKQSDKAFFSLLQWEIRRLLRDVDRIAEEENIRFINSGC